MKFKTIKPNSCSYGSKRKYSDIKYIVVHYTAGKNDTAEANAKYYANGNTRNAGAHYYVDAGDTVYKSVPLNLTAWAVGGNKYNDCNKTGGGKLYGICRNANSMSIEMCSSYERNPKVEENTLALIRWLMKKYKIDKDHVIRHFDVTGKYCPRTLMDEKAWKEFKDRI